MLAALAPDDIAHRVFIRARDLHQTQLGRLTQIDYDREMAFVAVAADGGKRETLGVVRAIADPDHRTAEFAIIVRSDLKGHGLGTILLRRRITYLRSRGTQCMEGEALADNARVFSLLRPYGFVKLPAASPSSVKLQLTLQSPAVLRRKAWSDGSRHTRRTMDRHERGGYSPRHLTFLSAAGRPSRTGRGADSRDRSVA